ncbi:hypothetical protein [Nocardioides sp. AN3]
MTGRAWVARRYLGYTLGFFAAFMLWLLLSAASAHADDGARSDDDSGAGVAASATHLVRDVTVPVVGDTRATLRRTTSTVQTTVAAVPDAGLEPTVEPVLSAVDRTSDAVTVVSASVVERPAHVGVGFIREPSTAATERPTATSSRHVTHRVPARSAHHVAASRTEVVMPPVPLPRASSSHGSSGIVAVTQSARAMAQAAARSQRDSLPLPEPQRPAIPHDQVTGASSLSVASDAALASDAQAAVAPLRSTFMTPGAVLISAADPLPDCSPD